MKLGRLSVVIGIYLNGGIEDYELLNELIEIQDEEGEDVAEFIAQLVASDYAQELEELIDNRREARR